MLTWLPSLVSPKNLAFWLERKVTLSFVFDLINLEYVEVCLSTGVHYGSGPQPSKHVRTTWEHVRIQMLRSCLIPMKSDIQTVGARTQCFFGLSRLVHCAATFESQCFLETELGLSWSPESRICLPSSVVSLVGNSVWLDINCFGPAIHICIDKFSWSSLRYSLWKWGKPPHFELTHFYVKCLLRPFICGWSNL